MNIEDDLRQAFRRKPAPPDLANRVLAQLEEAATPAPWATSRWRTSSQWLAAAAAVALAVAGATRYYAYQQTVAEAERVKQDIHIALQITSDTLAEVQRRVEASLQDDLR